MTEAGYSGTPLLRKLGYRHGQRALLMNVPETLPQLSGYDEFAARKLVKTWRGLSGGPFDLIHVFVTRADKLQVYMAIMRDQLAQDGMIWLSWPKKKSGMETSVDEHVARNSALQNGLVDIKKCALDEVWSGLKLVIPVKDRY
ncbi:DUF3052 family protein [Aquisalinus flavus]|uniref:DUF3052 domain-containing protein n=1 Tax=Aquisalinus flavus TaxID=1526572 RepID=A0A8J2V627_9PROT|nr:DUF3052 family protein [Aquisalinus flavus]GGD08511.1 hypothetical protein GCM10011342_16630 [Aquisalinus flavus]